MKIRSCFAKSLLTLMLWGGMVLGVSTTANAGGIDLAHRSENYGLVSQIEAQSGRIFTGMLFVVDSSSTMDSDSASAGNFITPFSTVDYAIGRASARTANTHPAANSGSLILVLPGHTENLSAADAVDADLAGITIWGVGGGDDRPTFTYTAAAGEFVIGANNVTIGNMRFIASITDVLIGIDIEGNVTGTQILNCEFLTELPGTDEFTDCINLTGTNTGTRIENCDIMMDLGGAANGINIDDEGSRIAIRNCTIRGDYSTACISGDTTLCSNIIIDGNLLVNGEAGNINAQPTIELLTGSIGVIKNNYCVSLTTAVASIVADTCFWFENYFNSDVGGTVTGTRIGMVHDGL